MPYEPTTITTILKQIKQVFNDQEADFVFRALTGKRYVDWFLTGENPNLDSDKFIKILEKKAEQPELPVQYLFKKAYFLNWELYIDQRAMIPRFETEELVMKAYHRLCQIKSPGEVRFIIDLGTGSGAIAIALAFLLPRAFIFATDVSKSALAVAKINVEKFGLKHRIKLICSDLFANIADHKPADLIIGNLPYLPENEIDDLPLTILKYEPVVALNGGKDGFALIAKVIQQSARYLKPDGFLALEIDPRQARLITEIKQVNSQIATADFEYDNNSLIRYAFIKYHNR